MPTLSILERRRIEAEIIKPIYEALKTEFGIEKAQQIVGDAIRAKAVEFGASLATLGTPSIRHFAELLPMWKQDGALETETLVESDDKFGFNVTRCRYAEMYREMGLQDIGHLLSCNRDASFCDGYDPRLKLARTQTIMQGATHCDFRYRWEEEQL